MRRLDGEKGYPFKESPRWPWKKEIERNPGGIFLPAVSVRLVVLKILRSEWLVNLAEKVG